MPPGVRFQLEIEWQVAEDCKGRDSHELPPGSNSGFFYPALPDNQRHEYQGDWCVNQNIPGIEQRHGAQTERTQDTDEPFRPVFEGFPSLIGKKKQKDQKYLVED